MGTRVGGALADEARMPDLLFVLGLALWSAGVGSRLLDAVRGSRVRSAESLALAVPLGLGALALATLGLGELGALNPTGLSVVLVVGVCWAGRNALEAGFLLVRTVPLARGCLRERVDWALAVGLLATLLGTLVTALAPVTDGDALCYHLQVPKVFLARGAVFFDPDLHETVYPLLTELLYAVALAFRGPVACRLIHWMLSLVFVANVTLLAWPSLGRRAWWAGAVALLVPAVSNSMSASLNDVALAAFGSAALVAWMRFHERPKVRSAILTGVFAGLAIGVKYPALVLCGILGMAIAARCASVVQSPAVRRVFETRFLPRRRVSRPESPVLQSLFSRADHIAAPAKPFPPLAKEGLGEVSQKLSATATRNSPQSLETSEPPTARQPGHMAPLGSPPLTPPSHGGERVGNRSERNTLGAEQRLVSDPHLSSRGQFANAIDFGYAKHIGHRDAPVLLSYLAAFVLTNLLVGGCWYLRAWLSTGNPVYPFFRQVFGGSGLDEVLDPIKRPLAVNVWNLATALVPLTLQPDRFDSFSHQFGPVFLLFLPALLIEKPSRRILGLASIGYLFLVLCLTQRQSMRFVLIALGPLSVAIAWLAARWWDRRSIPGRVLVGMLLLCLGLEAMIAVARARHGAAVVIGRESEAEFLSRREPTYRVGRWIAEHLPPIARIVGQDHRGFYLPRAYTMELAHRRRTGLGRRGESALVVVEQLRQAGFTHLLLCPPIPETAVEFDPTLGRLLAPWLKHRPALFDEAIQDGDGVTRRYAIYRLDDAVATRGGRTERR
jgi:hypothetical protein